ncbi:hypothetical protein [Pediococcus acidilactici]|jgi:hypothetical protein|uniref:hypothetical protein n=1 Tax=Pediococcus acidilactici TaxID=1254 RepID=UPI0013629255|nr:hypothetical protein [Pediococcus acidilactici]QHM55236.1 hypothetical protein C7M42_02000 [Pediococcus acidilactici]
MIISVEDLIDTSDMKMTDEEIYQGLVELGYIDSVKSEDIYPTSTFEVDLNTSQKDVSSLGKNEVSVNINNTQFLNCAA